MKNKKGTDMILSVYWFAILALVAAGIFVMVYLFYGHPSDVREMEVSILIDKIATCFAQGGRVLDNVGEINSGNFLEKCNLDFDVEEVFKIREGQYYVNISFDKLDNPENIFHEVIEVGNANFVSSCFSDDVEYKRQAICIQEKFYALSQDNKKIMITIFTSVRKTEKNAK